MNKEETLEKPEVKQCNGCTGRCSDFDEDCDKVPDKLHCFLYGTWGENSQRLPQGYCPFIHSEN